jgi:LacI family transcriptional regulator
MSHPKQIAIVLDPTSARRLTPGMFAAFKPGKAFLLVDALRPVAEQYAILRQWKPDGIVVRVRPESNQALLKLRKPTVICGGNRAAHLVSSVTSNSDLVGEMAARHLLDLGLKNLAFFGINAPFSPQRQRGFLAVLRKAGIRCESYIDRHSGWEHYMELLVDDDEGLAEWLKCLPKPVGIFAAHDPLGWHLSQVCSKVGIPVPEDVAIVAANNDELICNLSNPPLSSVAVPWDRVGEEVALAMDRMLEAQQRGHGRDLMGRFVRIAPQGVTVRQSTDLMEAGNKHLRSALAFIKQNVGDPISVTDILRHVPISRRKLEIDFARHLKRSPKVEITRVRIERARMLLAHTDLPIQLVAERCGYSYAERFTVAFRRTMGMPPAVFRRDMRSRG